MIVRPVLCRPFVGRLEELAYLRERLLEAGASHGGLVLVAGDAGVGKSRLIGEFATSLAYSRWKVGTGACLEFASRPYGPILEVLARIDAEPFDLGAAATKLEQFDAIVERFARVASRNAVVAVVEDLHWADAATLDLLAYFVTRLENMRVLVLASVRADELHPEHLATNAINRLARSGRVGRIDLGPLRGVDLQTFIDEALEGFALSAETRRAIALAGDGNPFFTEELLKTAVERKSKASAARGHREIPQSVRATLLERLRPFDDGELRIVTQAAMIGRTFGLHLLATTLETAPEGVLPTLRRARDLQLVEETDAAVFRFRHGLTRDAICAGFLQAELQPRHRTIALALESMPPGERSVEALAYHWWAAGDGTNAPRYNEQAGDGATRVHAHEDAIAFYERALEFDVAPIVRGGLVEKIAHRRLALSWTKEAQATYASAADVFAAASAHEREARCRVAAAITGYGTGLSNPTAPLEAMLARLSADEYVAAGRVHVGLAWLAATFWFPTRAAYHLRCVDERARREAPDIALRFANVSAWVAMTVGDLETFREHHKAWIEAARASSLHTLAGAYTNGAMCYAFFGLHEDAQDNLHRAMQIARDANSRHSEEAVHSFAALCYLLRGELELARDALGNVPPTSENHVDITFATAWGTVIGAALDDRDLIERWFDGFERTLTSKAKPEVECGGGFAEIMVRRGREADAASFLHRALPDCELMRGNLYTLLAIGKYGMPGDRLKARNYLVRGAEGDAELPERPALALYDAFMARREGRTDEARALAREAAAGFRRLRLPLFEAQALEESGDFAAALVLFRDCGAAYEARRLEKHAGVAPDVTALRQGPSVLSEREREIAELAAAGHSNLEIAAKLSITHKTVEKHLASAYRKLNITSRVQLARRLGPVARAAPG